jgi:hypothetical protein
MDSFPIIAAAIGSLILGFILVLMLMNIPRGLQSQHSWVRTNGRIQTFGVSYGMAEVAYEYEANGEKLVGNAIVPGPLAGYSKGIKARKSAYLDSNGRLKFTPGGEVPVYYNPANFNDAALVTGIQPGLWRGIASVLLIFALGVAGFTHWAWVERNAMVWFGATFCGGAAILAGYGLVCARRNQRSRQFPSTRGRLLEAKVAFDAGNNEGGGGFIPVVRFEYEVGGERFTSRQLTALSARVIQNNPQKVQAQLEQWKAQPDLTVFYDPQAPWDGFLQHGPTWGVFMPPLMGLAFAGFGVFMLLHHGHR